ncbi:hypothetical protein ACFL42_01715 [Candidatus Omnitrophota bacterium]
MKCALCSFEFCEKQAERSCCGCFRSGGCSMIRCPRCAYEVPRVPEWLKRMNGLLKKEKAR